MKKIKESFSLYARSFGKIFILMLPAILIGVICTSYPEKAIGMDAGAIKIPSNPATLILIVLSLVIFIVTIFWNQFAFSELINNKDAGFFEYYKKGWKRLATIFEKLKNLPKIFGKRILVVFVVWFAINGVTAFITQSLGVNFWPMKLIMSTLNVLILLPFFHIYGFLLYRNQKQ
jgi:hypothetical protein